MIIPIGHDHSIRRWPTVTIGIIVLCTLVQIWSSFLAPSPEDLLPRALQIAAEYDTPDGSEPTPEQEAQLERRLYDLLDEIPTQRLGYRTGSGFSINLITSAFAHGGWLHLIGNMLFLWLAGSALEDRYGRMRFALFYALGAIGATYAFEATAREPGILLVGASGAVSACMGAFLLHFHRAQIRFWYLLMYRSGTFQLAAWVALPLWLGEQFLWASLDSPDGRTTGVAYAAHIGGFAIGLAMGFAMSRLFPDDAVDDDVHYNESPDDPPPGRPSQRTIDPAVEERITKTYDAIDKRDASSARMLSSRVILDLARVQDDARIIELFDALKRSFAKAPLTVGAFAAAAAAADRRRDVQAYVAIADAMISEHPLGTDTPKVMWRLAQVHGDSGNHAAERETLAALAKRFPRDEYGKKAAKSLDG